MGCLTVLFYITYITNSQKSPSLLRTSKAKPRPMMLPARAPCSVGVICITICILSRKRMGIIIGGGMGACLDCASHRIEWDGGMVMEGKAGN